jgi:hypothetical protein
MFFTETELATIIKSKELNLIEYDSSLKLGTIVLNGCDLTPLITYAQQNNIKHIFYRYLYSDKEIFLVDMEHSTGYIYTAAKEEILLNNQKINGLDFTKPALLEVFCLHNGICIMMDFEASWIEGLLKKDDYLEMLKKKYTEELNIQRKKEEQIREALQTELKGKLLKDQDFTMCTNQNLRKAFFEKFIQKKENEKFKIPFMTNGRFSLWEALNYVDLVWAIFKSSKNK